MRIFLAAILLLVVNVASAKQDGFSARMQSAFKTAKTQSAIIDKNALLGYAGEDARHHLAAPSHTFIS